MVKTRSSDRQATIAISDVPKVTHCRAEEVDVGLFGDKPQTPGHIAFSSGQTTMVFGRFQSSQSSTMRRVT